MRMKGHWYCEVAVPNKLLAPIAAHIGHPLVGEETLVDLLIVETWEYDAGEPRTWSCPGVPDSWDLVDVEVSAVSLNHRDSVVEVQSQRALRAAFAELGVWAWGNVELKAEYL